MKPETKALSRKSVHPTARVGCFEARKAFQKAESSLFKRREVINRAVPSSHLGLNSGASPVSYPWKCLSFPQITRDRPITKRPPEYGSSLLDLA